MTTMDIIRRTKAAWRSIHTMTAEDKSRAASSPWRRASSGTRMRSCAANALDMDAARGKISDVMLDRLRLDAARIDGDGGRRARRGAAARSHGADPLARCSARTV